jgi:hypothetical protein
MATSMTSSCTSVSIRPHRTLVYTYVHIIDSVVVLLAVFVDDILLASRSEAVLAIVKADFQSRFTMTDEGLASEFLGVRIFQGTETVTLDQQYYCEIIVRDFGNYIGRRN